MEKNVSTEKIIWKRPLIGVDEDLWQKIETEAGRERRSLSNYLSRIIEIHYGKIEGKEN